jgi:hypothetical protein
MERETGIEPATSSLGSWRSTAELLPLRLMILAATRNRASGQRTMKQWRDVENLLRRKRNDRAGRDFIRHLEG